LGTVPSSLTGWIEGCVKLTPDLLLRAYAIGIFPMAESRESEEIHWIEPRYRGILPLDDLHVPRSLRKRLRQAPYKVTCDHAFAEVIAACAEPGPGRSETWINPAIERLYAALFRRGFAHSLECWQDGNLVGGLYGVSIRGAFFGESMFSRADDASKIALVHLVLRLTKGGYRLLDTQFETPHLARFGVIEITRNDYRDLLADALDQPACFPAGPLTEGELMRFLAGLR